MVHTKVSKQKSEYHQIPIFYRPSSVVVLVRQEVLSTFNQSCSVELLKGQSLVNAMFVPEHLWGLNEPSDGDDAEEEDDDYDDDDDDDEDEETTDEEAAEPIDSYCTLISKISWLPDSTTSEAAPN
jgi:hypothetical protein